MSKPDRATQEKFARTLREMVRRPENKVCADCKRNDPRWASWNLGVFLCIRCSGIHRGMGTHISKVKSVDLDVWTPEQMESIQKWGNRRANLYWEAHLKPGHNPPEHKMESFVRSKYESRRWAMDGPPPSDPSVLEQGGGHAAPEGAAPTQAEAPPPPVSTPTYASSSSRGAINRQPQAHQLLSSAYNRSAATSPPAPALRTAPTPAQAQPAAQPPQLLAPENDLFSLDFHAPATTPAPAAAPPQPKKDVKQDIMSLFSATPATTPATAGFGQFSSPATAAWGGAFSAQAQTQPQAQPTSMIGTGGVGAWGANSGWNAAPAPALQTNNVWATPTNTSQPPASLFDTSDIWGGSSSANTSTSPPVQSKKDDVFGDLWGGFK
ncbi:Smap1 protein [Coprinopsis cinerea okayama7|uniref:Smap1 protein n=1 Tax=Coprinopsis cinerea (strain Okayama-7 / 130 / ATCC MYA-4618 / FGSC 9003) TaxID=240176 RepID=A8N125_COPC7|nr:Smap1 protein [Coprinopsis cinerea okayama7\|eukprot:XP_001828574.1 Smap1 protein [Coprinopsis cinerea okayama7\